VLGTLVNTAVPTYAEISSLWGIAYLENLPFSPSTTSMLSSLPKMEVDVSLINAWGWVRYRDKSMTYLDGSVEIQDFMDVLVRDLGLEWHRKKRAGLKKLHFVGARANAKEWFWPYRGLDYDGLVEEYLHKYRLGESGKEDKEKNKKNKGKGVS